ncbi:MAG: hypothetical protein BWY47_01803 [Bacteroidetes bacterium ADurb.Bin302]|nr:MAG: hypothetical protein BWY47_01803 [Bacteroidetes bacterium ADurb.Bin302]
MVQTQIPGTQIKDASLTEDDLSFSDETTLNASISAHGLLPKLPNDANKFINGQGNWVVIPASAVSVVTTNFVALAGTDNTVQLALDKIDDLLTGVETLLAGI